MKVPTVEEAEAILNDAEKRNPGSWVDHNKVAGLCARKIAEKCKTLDPAIAYALGILHDIGRRYGVMDMRHIYRGYRFMMEQGFEDSARICLTHSFPYKNIMAYNGNNDCSDEESDFIREYLETIQYTDYDKLIQLCDSLAYPDRAVLIEKRLVEVAIRKGLNELTIPKWKEFLALKDYFDKKAGCNIYTLLDVKP